MTKRKIQLVGRVANVGRTVGTALVLKELPKPNDDFHITADDVLIVHNLTPDLVIKVIGIGALVAEVGGMTSHAATLAREFGIPCVVAVNNATSIVPNGAQIEVDGDKGVIRFWKKKSV